MLTCQTLAEPKPKAKAQALDYYGEYGEGDYNYADYGDYGQGECYNSVTMGTMDRVSAVTV